MVSGTILTDTLESIILKTDIGQSTVAYLTALHISPIYFPLNFPFQLNILAQHGSASHKKIQAITLQIYTQIK